MASSRELSGRLAVVTGGTSGIGAATVRRLADAGARVLVVARTHERADRMATEIGGVAVSADVAQQSGVSVVQDAVRAAGMAAPDIVVHAAGAFRLAPLVDTEVADFDRILAVNLRAAFLLIRAFVPAMVARGSGDILAIGSIAGRHAFPANGAYGASKFGLRGLCAVLSAELRRTGVRATIVEPAATDTPLWDGIDMTATPGLPRRADMLAAEAVADAVLYAVTRPREVALPNLLVERA
jgi:NADP-dependent 3-hydroxy acid dehydrogenase YdfG